MDPFTLIKGVISVVGAGVGLFSSASNAALSAQLQELNAQEAEMNAVEKLQLNFVNNFSTYSDATYQKNTLGLQVKNNRLQLKQTGSNISAYDQALSRYDTQYAAGLKNLQSQGRSQYYSLMEQFGGVNVANAARGQMGGSGSASLIAQMAKNQVIDYVGEDMKLDANGGTYGYSLTDYFLDQLADLNESKGNRDIQAQSWDVYHDTLIQNMENYDTSKKLQETSLDNMRKAFDTLYSYYGDDITSSYDSYQKSLEEYNTALDAWLNGNDSYGNAETLRNSYNSLKQNYDAYAELIQKQADAISPFNQDLINQFISGGDKTYDLDFSNKLADGWTALSDNYNTISGKIDSILDVDDDDDDNDANWMLDNSSAYDSGKYNGGQEQQDLLNEQDQMREIEKEREKYSKGWKGR